MAIRDRYPDCGPLCMGGSDHGIAHAVFGMHGRGTALPFLVDRPAQCGHHQPRRRQRTGLGDRPGSFRHPSARRRALATPNRRTVGCVLLGAGRKNSAGCGGDRRLRMDLGGACRASDLPNPSQSLCRDASRQANFLEMRGKIPARRHVLDVGRQLALPIWIFPIGSGHVHRVSHAQ
jgi:hypothetical protein